MTAIMIEFLWSLYFIGVSLPALFSDTRPRPIGVVIQFVFGVVLFVLAILHISLVH